MTETTNLDLFACAPILGVVGTLEYKDREAFWWKHFPGGDSVRVLTAPRGRHTARERAAAWYNIISRGELWGLAWLVVKTRMKGWEDVRNFDAEFFESSEKANGNKSFALKLAAGKVLAGTDARRGCEEFIRNYEKIKAVFPVREMLLYAIVHARSCAHFKWVVSFLGKDLRKCWQADGLGLTPYFYLSFRGYDEASAFCDVLESQGGRMDRKCAYGFSWKDYVAFVRELSEKSTQRPSLDESKAKVDLRPVPELAEIPQLLKNDPESGIVCLAAQRYRPPSPQDPFGPAELLLDKALTDRSLPRETRSLLFRTFVLGRFPIDCMVQGMKRVPQGLLDLPSARRWYCENQKPGWEYVRCSDAGLFLKGVGRNPKPAEAALDEAMRKDNVSQFALNMTLTGRKPTARVLVALLNEQSCRILFHLIRTDKAFAKQFDEKALLFYACAHWPTKVVRSVLAEAEKANPGICRDCVDRQGRNLLWYLTYRPNYCYVSFRDELEPILKTFGCTPDQETAWGLSFRDIREGGRDLPYEVRTIGGQGIAPYGLVIASGGYDVGSCGYISHEMVDDVRSASSMTFEDTRFELRWSDELYWKPNNLVRYARVGWFDFAVSLRA